MKSGKVSPVLWIVLGVSLGLLGFFLLLANPFGWKLPIPSITRQTTDQEDKLPDGVVKAPTPYLFLPHGKQTYNARGSENKKSSVTSITYDPLDPQRNANQTISATVESSEPVKSVTLTINTDKQTNTHAMSLTSGTTSKGVWTVTVISSDTYDQIYNVSFEIITELGNKTTQPMPLR